MGIVNVTPDSFSDGGRFLDVERAVSHALSLVGEGADIVDVGGESTRPGSHGVVLEDELARVMPVIEGIRRVSDVPLSIDTSKAEVMAQAVAGGADMVNDVRSLRGAGALRWAASVEVPVVLMHMLGEPRTMQRDPRYVDVVTEVRDFLLAQVRTCEDAGIARDRLLLDPGIGFGKTVEHNLSLLKHLATLRDTGQPVLVGASRKSMLARIVGPGQGRRLVASVVAAVHAARAGASVVRVHDVAATLDGLRVNASIEQAG